MALDVYCGRKTTTQQQLVVWFNLAQVSGIWINKPFRLTLVRWYGGYGHILERHMQVIWHPCCSCIDLLTAQLNLGQATLLCSVYSSFCYFHRGEAASVTCCLTWQYDSFWLEVWSGAQELKVIIFVCACIVYVSIRIRRNTRCRKQEMNSSFCGRRGSGSVLKGRYFLLREKFLPLGVDPTDPIPLSVYSSTLSLWYFNVHAY